MSKPKLKPCPFCGGSARVSTRTDECIWSHDQVEWTAVSCSGGPNFDCLQPSVDWPTSATDENDTQLSISQWNRRALPAAPAEAARAEALREAIQLVGNQAVEILLRHKPDASPILKQATRQGITAPLRALLKEAKP